MDSKFSIRGHLRPRSVALRDDRGRKRMFAMHFHGGGSRQQLVLGKRGRWQ